MQDGHLTAQTIMNAPEFLPRAALADVQSSVDVRRLAIQRVGVKSVRHPLRVATLAGVAQPTIGIWDLYVHLSETQKGTHMSRFIAMLEERQQQGAVLDIAGFRAMLSSMVERLEAQAGHVEVRFPFFIEKAAPVSGVTSLLDYNITLVGDLGADGSTRVDLIVEAPVTSLCPCSKEISDFGAHNQRSHVTIRAELKADLTIEDLVRVAEDESSCELYGLLKRPDEKFVTERAYDNPKFVEDLVRDVVSRLQSDARLGAFAVEVENFESIHNHSAYARIERN
jgi:GTP cyclohydrolase I